MEPVLPLVGLRRGSPQRPAGSRGGGRGAGGGPAAWLTAALVVPDKPPALQPRAEHLPPSQLRLPPPALLGLPVPQAVLRGAHLPLEAERGQAGLRDLRHGPSSSASTGQGVRAAQVPALGPPCHRSSGASAGRGPGPHPSHLPRLRGHGSDSGRGRGPRASGLCSRNSVFASTHTCSSAVMARSSALCP